jgi:hypothetical protein
MRSILNYVISSNDSDLRLSPVVQIPAWIQVPWLNFIVFGFRFVLVRLDKC